MAWYEDLVVGALGAGVNHPTLIALNIAIAFAFGTLLMLFYASILKNPSMIPHVVVLIVLALGLWISINWFISNVGLVDAQQQHEELFGKDQKPDAEDTNQTGSTVEGRAQTAAALDPEPKKEQ